MKTCPKHPKYLARRAPTADCQACRDIFAATPEQRRLRRNARQQAYRARPGRAEAEALASRKSYWRRLDAKLVLLGTSKGWDCACLLCKTAAKALAKPYRARSRRAS